MKKLTSVMVAMAAMALVPSVIQANEDPSFFDVDATNTHFEAIERMTDRGIIQGYQDGTYRPSANISRGQVATLIARALELHLPGEGELPASIYRDVRRDHTQAAAIYAVQEAGVMTGSNEYFNPSAQISREQMATVLVRAFDLERVVEGGNQDPVTDLTNASATHRANISILSQHEITRTSDGSFRPRNQVTRGQFASFMDRALSVVYTKELGITRVQQVDDYTFDVHFTEEIERLSPENFSFDGDVDILDAYRLEGLETIRLITTEATFGVRSTLLYQEGRTSYSFVGTGGSDIEGMLPMGTLLDEVIKTKGTPKLEGFFLGGPYILYDMNGYFYDWYDDAHPVTGYWISNPTTNIFGARVGMTLEELNSHFGTNVKASFSEGEGMYTFDFNVNGYDLWFSANRPMADRQMLLYRNALNDRDRYDDMRCSGFFY